MAPRLETRHGEAHAAALRTLEHRPYPLPAGRPRMRQRWNDLLFAHWPIAASAMAPLLPPGLEVDTHEGWAWAGVVPFWMDAVESRVVGERQIGVPGARSFAELNLRTYVRSPRTGLRGVFFFSLDCGSPLAVLGARTLFHLPYFLADISRSESAEGIRYRSSRRLVRRPVRFDATYRALQTPSSPCTEGSLEHFLTERYCLFTPVAGRVLTGDIHHLPWPLEPAEAEIRLNELPAAHGLTLPDRPPVLHFARELHVSIWGLRTDVLPPAS